MNKKYVIREEHGLSNEALYEVWNQMIYRCENPHHQSYRLYGARGIRVCQTWHRYIVFRKWALGNGYHKGLSLDRINPNGDYKPSNCQFIPQSENARRGRGTRHRITAFGETKTVGQWVQDSRCPLKKESALRMRVLRGWAEETAIVTPLLHKG